MAEFCVKLINKQRIIEMFKKIQPTQQKSVLFDLIPNERFYIKASDSETSFVKYLTEDFDQIFEILPDQEITEGHLLIGFYDIERVIAILAFFGDGDIVKFNIGKIVDNTNKAKKNKKNDESVSILPDSYIDVDSVVFQSKSMKFEVNCADLEIFEYIKDEDMEDVIATDECELFFKFDSEERKKLSEIIKLDSKSANTKIEYSKKGIRFSGSGWNYKPKFSEITNNSESDMLVILSNKVFSVLDKELYDVYLSPSKVIFKSTETLNIIIGAPADLSGND